MNHELKRRVFETIAYYDALNYPLTAFEIWKHLTVADSNAPSFIQEEISLNKVMFALEDSAMRRRVNEFQGFYFLRGKKELVLERLHRNKISAEKIKRLKRIVWLLRFIPFVRMIAVTGRLAVKNAQFLSDWDLFIVLKSGKIWTGRTLVTAFLHLIGKRRHGQKIKDRVCLNYFITDDSLEIKNKDLFAAHEYSFIFPLFGEKVFRKFQLKNKWIKNFKPNYSITEINNLKLLRDSIFSRFVRTVREKILNWNFLENWLRKWEREKIACNPKTHQEGSIIEASDKALVFLPEPQSSEIFEKFKKKISGVII